MKILVGKGRQQQTGISKTGMGGGGASSGKINKGKKNASYGRERHKRRNGTVSVKKSPKGPVRGQREKRSKKYLWAITESAQRKGG